MTSEVRADGHQNLLRSVLPKQERLLAGVAEATRQLLTIADFDTAVNSALEVIATSADIDRIYILENYIDSRTGEELGILHYEWTACDVVRGQDITGRFPMSYADFGDWLDRWKVGEELQALAQDLSESAQELQKKDEALSLLTVPISLGNHLWGVIGFDDCTTERVWSEAEIAVLETAAASFAGALERRDNLAELQRRDSLLKSVNEAAQCLVAMSELEQAIPEALQILGEGTQQDRVYVFENVFPKGPDEVFWEIPYEWVNTGIPTSAEVATTGWPIAMASFPPIVNDSFLIGQEVQFLTRNLQGEAQQLNEKGQTLSLLAIPIKVSSEWWGVLGFDDCTTERVWSEAEIAVLETAAACIGSAIKRDRNQKQKETTAQARSAEQEAHNPVLAGRDRILEATAAAANIMLTDENFDSAINTALAIVGNGLEVDRILLGQHIDASLTDERSYIQFIHEWDSAGTTRQLEHLELAKVSIDGIEYIYESLCQGQVFGGIIDELPEPFRSGQIELGVKSTYSVPIMVEGDYWGVIAFDDCHQLTRRSEAELEALTTLANCIGNAVDRDRTRKEKEAAAKARAAELAERDRILEATAAAANVMLTEEDFESAVNAALQIVGKGLAVDRIALGQYTEASSPQDVGYHRFLFEWDSDDTPAQIENSELATITDGSIELYIESLKRGKGFGGIVDEMEEPFRSKQKELEVQSTYAVPIRINSQYWGMIGFDDCHAPTRRSDAELEALMILANCIGGAIDRDRTRKEQDAVAQARAAELEAANQVLTTRDRWLETTTTAANVLLFGTDVSESVNAALQTIGENLECDSVFVVQGIGKKNAPDEIEFIQVTYEWYAEGQSPHPDNPEPIIAPTKRFQETAQHLNSGKWIGGMVEELPEPIRSDQLALGVKSLYAVPVFFAGKLWGAIGLKHCQESKRLSQEEISVFQTAATCIGSAIHRDQMRRDREQAERDTLLQQAREQAAQKRAAALEIYNRQLQQRDTLLNSVNAAAQSLVANEDLATALPTMLKILGEGTGQCRAYILRNSLDEHTGQLLFNLMLEWDAPQIPPKMEVGAHFPVPIDHFPDHLTAPLKAGRATQFIASELDGIKPAERQPGQALSLVGVPIMVGGEWWGLLGLDDCVEERVWSDTEVAVLETAASAVGSAVECDLSGQARETAEKAVLAEREKAARERAAELAKTNEAIARSLTSLAASPELDQFLGAIIAEMARQLNACKVHLFLYDEPTHTLTQSFVIQDGQIYLGTGPNDPEMFSQPIPADITPAWNAIINGERPLIYDETQPYDEEIWWPETLVWHKAQGHKAITAIPMKAGDVPIGYIGFCFYDRTVLSDEQLEFMQALANQAIVAIQLTRLADEAKQAAILQEQEKAARDRATELAKTNEAISQTLDALTTEPELDRFLGQILTQIIEQIGADDAHLFLYDAETHTLHSQLAVQNNTVYAGNAPGDPELFYTDITADITAAWQILVDASRPVTLDENNPDTAEFFWPKTLEWHTSRGHQSATCACMKIGNEPIGFIGFAFCDQTVLSSEQLEFVQALTNQATLAIHLTRLAEQARTNALNDERNRLAREIHDTLAQAFTGISLQLEAAKGILTEKPNQAQTYLKQARDLAHQGLSEARRSVHALRAQALEIATLAEAIQTSLYDMTRGTSLKPAFHQVGKPCALSEDLQLNLLRISQEAITNALRHAQAQTITITLTFDAKQVLLYIIDNGIGFAPQKLPNISGFGLIGIRERTARFKGQFKLTSQPGTGTTLTVIIPLSNYVL